MADIFIKLILWLVIWFSVWAVFYFISSGKMNYVEKYKLTAVFFLLVSILIVIFFYKDLYLLIKLNFPFAPLVSLVILFIFNSFAYRYVDKFFPDYKKAFEADGTLYFAKFDNKYLFSKSFEIFYQQIMIALLSIWLAESGLSFFAIGFVFALVFGLGHILLFFYSRKSVGLFFLIASVISSFVFPFLILMVQWGFIYSYIFHWIFYIIAGFIFIRSTKSLGIDKI